ncbi:hypothetical protein GQ43DRAFT_402278 [Delitschia confertaspora ATCC 74209]|uniref:Fibronectin type-III domain-containing protein n=1 Tax=Delitschia confertaspora ATCC 74209 TaxID=1513339 RepID=A0A9P4JH02_9PLEO|nr:hypothetical protein GQ43DRAFT_402278 [Delitschia confertaspora ATCC 74209]
MLSEPAYAIYWHPNVAHYNMDTIAFYYSAGWLKTFCVVLALFWVAYRGYQVLSKPVEELVNLLGVEVPVAPVVSLAGIKSDGVLLHWKLPGPGGSVAKYIVRINGIDVGDVSPQETSITIENLQPDHHYVIRIINLNTALFQAPSNPIRLKTLPASSGQFYNTAPHKDNRDDGNDDEYTPTPLIRPNKNLVDAVAPTVNPPVISREHSNSLSRVRRAEPVRRNSPALQNTDQARSAQEADDSAESVKQLTEKLDALRREIDEVEKQITEEEEEFQSARGALIDERDEKKQALKKKEDASRDLRKEVATLERANTAAQAKKTQQERTLRQKEGERKKMKDDVTRWRREIREFQEGAKRLEAERLEHKAASAEKMQYLKEKLAEETQTNKSLEEDIREKGSQVKVLEEERKKLTEADEGTGTPETIDNSEAEEDHQWLLLLSSMQQRYAQAYSMVVDAERANHLAVERLAFLQQRRASQPSLFSNMQSQDPLPTRRNSRSMRPVSMREPLSSAVPGGFVHSSAAPFNSSIPSASPSYSTAAPYFNINNGMALAPTISNQSFLSQGDIESLNGGGPMSPTAGALLPSDLLGDETDRTDTEDEGETAPARLTVNPSPTLHGLLPGLGAPAAQDQDPISPVSVQSRSPSAFASPRESAGQLAHYPANENMADSDKRSIRSTSSSLLAAGGHTTRFGNLFGLNRQRGKTFSDQGPTLGSLKTAQSQSLPRQEPGGLDPIGTRRRRGSHSGGAWYDAFVRSSKTAAAAESSDSPKHVATRKRPFNMFGSKGEPWLTSTLGNDRPSSPRPASTKSTDVTALPRPSTEAQTRFGWNVEGLGARSSPLGPDWSMGNTTSWSRMQSRRPSIQHGSTASLAHEELFTNDTPDFPTTTGSPTQAPIGTRPQSSSSNMPPFGANSATPQKQLNPAAPHFKSLFSREKKSADDKAKRAAERAAEKAAEKEAKEAKKAEKSQEKKAKADKASRKDKEKGMYTELTANESGKEVSSPIGSRWSRDNYSISTADESNASRRESLERSVSQTPSEALIHANSIGKETFMQKLSRKSSSSQFLPFGKGKAGLFSKKTTSEVYASDTDEDSNVYMGRGAEIVTSSPLLGAPKDKASALSWSSIKRMGKRGEKTPSLHESIASETTGDEEEGLLEGVVGTA